MDAFVESAFYQVQSHEDSADEIQPVQLSVHHSSFCGDMTEICMHCGALYFDKEVNSSNEFNICCMKGKINLPSMSTLPSNFIQDLLLGKSPYSKVFKNNCVRINSMVSIAKVHMHSVHMPPGVPVIRISQNVYSKIPGIFTTPTRNTRLEDCLQHIFYDGIISGMSIEEGELLSLLIAEIRKYNPYVRSIKSILETTEWDELPSYRLVFSSDPPEGVHRGCSNAPNSSTGMGVLLHSDTAEQTYRQCVINFTSGGSAIIRSTSPFYDPYNYVLYHLLGDYGWTYDMTCRVEGTTNCHKITAREYYSYRAHVRDQLHVRNAIGEDILFYGGRLSLRYFVDMYCKIEENTLNWIRYNQNTIKAELYDSDHLSGAEEEMRKIILPASFSGSPRYYVTHFQDCMSIVHHYGKPTYFITFTANSNWKEIVDNLKWGQKPEDRPDLVNRVFKMKLKMLLDDLTVRQVLGRITAHMYVIEFQKRGLPHAHILLFSHEKDVPQSSEDFDKIVCAELPDPVKNPKLYKIVTACMFHRPCSKGSVCWDGGSCCSKNYPKDLNEFTHSNNENDYYPVYRRRDIIESTDGSPTKKFLWKDTWVDNRWIVPYNPYLTLKYVDHIIHIHRFLLLLL